MHRLTSLLAALLLIAPNCPAQSVGVSSVGDSVAVKNENVRTEPRASSKAITRIDGVRAGLLTEKSGQYYKIDFGEFEGWVFRRSVSNRPLVERKRYFRRINEEEGFTLGLLGQSLLTNSADGITVSLDVKNISDDKTIKYLMIRWKLFNPVGDPASGEHGTASSTSTRFVGPIEPGERADAEFENLWYSSVGQCAEVRRIEVQHVDGTSFIYVSDLEDISRYGNSAEFAQEVKLRGDCSYKAQN
jgi:hypothetical protein